MTTWRDDDHIEGEMDDTAFLDAVGEAMRARLEEEERIEKPLRYGNDGLLTVYQEIQDYRDVRYVLAVVRYWWVQRGPEGLAFCPDEGRPHWNRIGKHVVVETPDGRPEDDFLWHDNLHFFSESWTLRQQWDWAQAQAHRDIDTYWARQEGAPNSTITP